MLKKELQRRHLFSEAAFRTATAGTLVFVLMLTMFSGLRLSHFGELLVFFIPVAAWFVLSAFVAYATFLLAGVPKTNTGRVAQMCIFSLIGFSVCYLFGSFEPIEPQKKILAASGGMTGAIGAQALWVACGKLKIPDSGKRQI